MSRSVSLLSLLSLLSLIPTPTHAQDPVDWHDAAQCVGRACSVRGTVAAEEQDGPVTRLYFDAARRDVYVTLVRGWLVTWPSYAGKRIVATGSVDRFRNDVEMIVESPNSIVLADATPADAPTPALRAPSPTAAEPSPTAIAATPTLVAPTAAPTPGEADRLRERVRELEDRVRELESP